MIDNYTIILGAGTMQVPAILEAHALGYKVIAIDGNPQAPGNTLADIFFPIDLKDTQAILKQLGKSNLRNKIAGVFTAGTDFSLSVAQLAHALDIPGNSIETARNASDKGVMRKCFHDAGVQSPRFFILTREKDLDEQLGQTIHSLNLPWVIKPVDNMGSRGVVKVNNHDEVLSSVQTAFNYSRSGQIIVEEFIAGPEFSIDSLFYKGEILCWSIAIRHIHFPPFFIETGHSFPSTLSPEQERVVLDEFTKAVRALGIQNGAAKGDVFLSPQGPRIGEIAARLSGGYMSGWTLPYATGINITRAALQIAHGLEPDPFPKATKFWFVQERAIVSFPGTVKEEYFFDNPQSLSTFKNWFSRAQPGDILRFPRNNVEKAGNYIFAGPEEDVVQNQITKAVEWTFYRLSTETIEGSVLFDPMDDSVPIAYPKAWSGKPDLQEVSWDGRSLGLAKSQFSQLVPGISFDDYPFLEAILFRYGLQAIVLTADIVNDGTKHEDSIRRISITYSGYTNQKVL